MTIDIQNTSTGLGWAEYSMGKDGKRKNAKLIKGDTFLSDKITKSIDYKSGDTIRFVISFADDDNVSPEEARKIVEEFFTEFMIGFPKEEYLLDIVEHTDTDYLHYHARIPKLNLLTLTQLKVYWHKADLGFKKAIIDKLADKYGLVTGADRKNLIPNPNKKIEYIHKWKVDNGQEPFDLSMRKGRAVAEENISDYFSNAILGGYIDSLDEIRQELEEMGFDIKKEDYDRTQGFHYLTIENESGKIRLKGEIYGRKFHENTRKNKTEAISNNRSMGTGNRREGKSEHEINRTLEKERKKRLEFIEKQYSSARKRAHERLAKKPSKSQKNTALFTAHIPNNWNNYWVIKKPLSLYRAPRYPSNTGRRDSKWEGWNGVLSSKQIKKYNKEIADDSTRGTTHRTNRNTRGVSRTRMEQISRARQRTLARNDEFIRTFNERISRESQRCTQERQQRRERYNNLAKNCLKPTRADIGTIGDTTEKQGYKRGVREAFEAIIRAVTRVVYRLKSSFSSVHRDIEQSYSDRNEQLIALVTSVVDSRKTVDIGRKKKKRTIKILK